MNSARRSTDRRPRSTGSSSAVQATTAVQASNPPESSKRKRQVPDSGVPSATPSNSSGSWWGMAIQLPSVIKKEFSEFVKTVREGSTHPPPAAPSSIPVPHQEEDQAASVGRRSAASKSRRSSRLSSSVEGRKPTRSHRKPVVYQPNRLSVPGAQAEDAEQPSPKKPKLSRSANSSERSKMPHNDNSNPVNPPTMDYQLALPIDENSISSFGSLGFSPARPSTQTELGYLDRYSPRFLDTWGERVSSMLFPETRPTDSESLSQTPPPVRVEFGWAYSSGGSPGEAPGTRQTALQLQASTDPDMEEEVLARSKPNPASLDDIVFGSNSVSFPNSLRVSHEHVGSQIPLNSDQPLSLGQTSSSLMSSRLSMNSSQTSNTSTNLTNCFEPNNSRPVRLDSAGSVTSPRIRHTKLLGTPRDPSRIHTLSASSFSSLASFSSNPRFQPSNLRSVPSDSQPQNLKSKQEAQNQTGDVTECINGHLPPDSSLGATSSNRSSIKPRQKVPLAEIIGKSSMSQMSTASPSQSPMRFATGALQQSPSIASIQSTIVRFNTAQRNGASFFMEDTGDCRTHQMDRPLIQNTHANAQASNSPAINSKPPHQLDENSNSYDPSTTDNARASNTHTLATKIVEVDEDHEDDSFELLSREEAILSSPPTSNRKRKRKLHHPFSRQGLAAIEQSSSKLIDLLPHQSMRKLGLLRSSTKSHVVGETSKKRLSRSQAPALPSQSMPVPHVVDPDEGEESAAVEVTPNKKIRILESEIARLKQELETEKVKRVLESSARKSSRRASHTAAMSNQGAHRVKFSPRSTFSSPSPPPAEPSRKFLSKSHSAALATALSDSPVLIKKPVEGALVGGSPIIVSRVYGEGPEVVGERTPVQAEKWFQKQKLNQVSQTSARLPGLAQDLFGAKSSRLQQSSARGGSSRSKHCSQPLDAAQRDRLTQALGATASAQSTTPTGWQRDHQLDADLLGTIQPPRRFINLSTSKRVSLPPGCTTPLSPSKLCKSWRNSGSFNRPSSSNPPDMQTFLNELKTSGRNKLKKTPGSKKYYNGLCSFGSPGPRSSIGPRQITRPIDPKNAKILNMVMERNFGPTSKVPSGSRNSSATCGTATTSGSTNTCGSTQNITDSTDHTSYSTQSTSSAVPTDQAKSPLARRIYPGSAPPIADGHPVEGEDEIRIILGEAISTPASPTSLREQSATSRKKVNHLTSPNSPVSKDFTMAELIEQVSNLKSNHLNNEFQTLPSDSRLKNRELVHQMGLCSSVDTSFDQSPTEPIFHDRTNLATGSSTKQQLSKNTAQEVFLRPRSSPVLENIKQDQVRSPAKTRREGLKAVDRLTSSAIVRPISILINNPNRLSEPKTDVTHRTGLVIHGNSPEQDLLGSSDKSISTGKQTRRVRIYEDENNMSAMSRRLSLGSNRKQSVDMVIKTDQNMDENVDSRQTGGEVVMEDDEMIMGVGQKIRDVDGIVGWGLQPGVAKSTSGSGWVMIKPNTNQSSDGEPNLRRWSLKASAIISVHPKLI